MSNRKLIGIIGICSVLICLIMAKNLFYSSSMKNENIQSVQEESKVSPLLENFELILRHGEYIIADEKRDSIDLYMKYKFNIINNPNDDLYSIIIQLPEQIAADIGYGEVTKDIFNTENMIIDTSIISMVLPNSHSELLDSYNFKVNLFKDDIKIQSLFVSSLIAE